MTAGRRTLAVVVLGAILGHLLSPMSPLEAIGLGAAVATAIVCLFPMTK